MNWCYREVAEFIDDPELGKYHTYGIQASRKVIRGWELIEFIHDVTTDRRIVNLLVNLFNLHQLSPVYLRDALEDMLP